MRILLAEDDSSLRGFLTRALERDDASLVLAPELVLYYQNRLVGWPEFA